MSADIINYNPRLLKRISQLRLFKDDPFIYLDVGCRGGVSEVWKTLNPDFIYYGIDPDAEEINRLTENESNPNYHYFNYFAGLPPDDMFFKDDEARNLTKEEFEYYNPWMNYSFHRAREIQKQPPEIDNIDLMPQNNETAERIPLGEFIQNHSIQNLDFLKIDTDGYDYEVIASADPAIDELQTLGMSIEIFINQPYFKSSNSIYHIDPFLRKKGFILHELKLRKHSRKDLPAKFLFSNCILTATGQPVWADAIYAKNGASPHFSALFNKSLSTIKLLKLACIYDVFHLPDCAAECINTRKDDIARLADPEDLLNHLTPLMTIQGKSGYLTYAQYIRMFETQFQIFKP